MSQEINEKISIIDFGGQYAHLIANRIRRMGVYTQIIHNTESLAKLKNSKGIILSGGPQSVNTHTSPQINTKIFDLGIPILGICYGHQLICHHFGAKIGNAPEYGPCELNLKADSKLYRNCDTKSVIWQNHGDVISSLPEGFEIIGTTKKDPLSSLQNRQRNIYTTQFHPEAGHSGITGQNILKNFVFEICTAKPSWSMGMYLKILKQEIIEQVGDKKVFLLVSGGVDSSVCFALLNEILGKEKVFGLHIDNGMMRQNESKDIEIFLKEKGLDNLHIYHAEKEFLDALKKIYEPEQKRNIIGKVYLEVKDKALDKYNLDPQEWMLAQGTIYPDTIESGGTKNADTIKTHHNRVDQIQELIKKGLVVEPLKELYKDEVRELGRLIGLPNHLVDRHPFPGPGLGIRALCCTQTGQTQAINEFDILPIQTVGIKGDARSYAKAASFTGSYHFENLQKMMLDITSQNKDINRLIYNISQQSLSNIHTHKQYITKEYLDILRKADHITNTILKQKNLHKKIWQCPIIILPCGTDEKPYSIVIRAIDSEDAMSASAIDLGKNVLVEIQQTIMQNIDGIYTVFYDLTSKPPGTIEWE